MPYTVEWYVPNHVIYCRLFGEVTVEEVLWANEDTIQLLETHQDFPIHVIASSLDIEKVPLNLRRMTEAAKSIKHPHLGWFVFLTTNKIQEFLGNAIGQILGHNQMKGVPSMTDAIALISKHDPDIDWSQARKNDDALHG